SRAALTSGSSRSARRHILSWWRRIGCSCSERCNCFLIGRASQTDELMRATIRNDAGAMKLPRRNFLHLVAGTAALPAVSRIAWAQPYPSQPVRIIVGLPAGTATDILARLVGQSLSERLGKQFIVENRPGAGGNIGTEAVVRASPDGYTLLQVN